MRTTVSAAVKRISTYKMEEDDANIVGSPQAKEATGRKDASRSMRLDARPEVLGVSAYSSVPNRRIGPNKRAGGKILRKH